MRSLSSEAAIGLIGTRIPQIAVISPIYRSVFLYARIFIIMNRAILRVHDSQQFDNVRFRLKM